jgi:hypothetical protein
LEHNTGKEGRTEEANRPHTLMYGLLYPAFLGTFLFGAYDHWHSYQDNGLYFWLLYLLFYFCTQFVESSTTFKQGYDLGNFTSDAIELALQILLFAVLSSAAMASQGPESLLRKFFLLLTVLFLLPAIYHRQEKNRNRGDYYCLNRLSAGAVTSPLLGLAASFPLWSRYGLDRISTAIRASVLPTLVALTVVYCLVLWARSHEGHVRKFVNGGFWKTKLSLVSVLLVPTIIVIYVIRR